MSNPTDPDIVAGDGLSRRRFLAATAATVAGAAALPATALRAGAQTASTSPAAPAPTTAASGATTAKSGEGILVLITLYGGNDGLNTVTPFADSAYLAGRGELAHKADQVLRLDDAYGLHPSLPGLKGLWDARQLAIVHGVGYPSPNRSHFRSMDIWQTASPDSFVPTGWLGRWHDSTGPDPLRMVSIGTSLPRAMLGTKGSGAVLRVGRVQVPGNAVLQRAYVELTRVGAGAELGAWGGRLAASGADLLRVNQTLGPLINNVTTAAPAGVSTSLEGGASAAGTSTTQRNELEVQLDQIAALIKAGAPGRVYGASLGGFDTHASQKDAHARLMSVLDRGMAGFVRDMASHPRGGGVTVMVYSEFGRRVAANLSGGTDHGTAAPVLMAGPAVKGGHYGQPASLSDLDQGDLKYTTDFRTVYATVLERVLGIESAAVLGKSFTAVPAL